MTNTLSKSIAVSFMEMYGYFPTFNDEFTYSAEAIHPGLLAINFEDNGTDDDSGAGGLKFYFKVGNRVGHECALGGNNIELCKFELV